MEKKYKIYVYVMIILLVIMGMLLLTLVSADISFTTPTPASGSSTLNGNVPINASVSATNLSSLIYNWNGNNYTFYDPSLVLLMNFENNSAIGETDDYMVDSSRYGNNGGANAGYQDLVPGVYGNAWDFTAKVNPNNSLSGGMIDLGNTNSLKYFGHNLTVAVWVKPHDDSKLFMSIMNKWSGGSGNNAWILSTRYGYFNFGIENSSGSSGVKSIEYPFTKEQWYFLSGTYDGSTMKLFINGNLVNSTAHSGDIHAIDYHMYIGAFLAGSVWWLNGTLDNPMVFNRTLSDSEINQLYLMNIQQASPTQWYLNVNQSNIAPGTYNYQAFYTDALGSNQTNLSTINVDQINVTLNQPQNGYSLQSPVTFNCSASNLFGLSNVTFYIWDSTGSQINATTKNISGFSNSTTFSLTVNDGSYTWNCLAGNNLTSSNWASSNHSFFISNNYPAITLLQPSNNTYLNYKNNIYINYTAVDTTGLDTCDLFSDFTGSYLKNYTWIRPNNNSMNFTTANLLDGVYNWNVRCNNTGGSSGFSPNNFTFTVDTIYPILNITNIGITPDIQTIKFNSTENDTNLLSCKYSIYDSTGAIDFISENLSFTCNSQVTAVVTGFATYILRTYARDRATNENYTEQNFTTYRSGNPPGGGGGGDNNPETIEKIPVIGLMDINSTKPYNDLEREVFFSAINSQCAKKADGQNLAIEDLSGECTLSITELNIVRNNIESLGFSASIDDIMSFFKSYSNKKLFQGFEDKETLIKYNLFSSVLGITNPMTINPPSINTPFVFYQVSGNKTIEKVFTVNKPIKECSAIEGDNITCEILTNTTFKLKYYIGDVRFFNKIFTGKLSVTSDAKPEFLEVKIVPIALNVYNLGLPVFGIPSWLIFLVVIILVVLVIFIIVKNKKFKKYIE